MADINPITTYDIKDLEIFEAGTWNGEKYTERDLDDMVESFQAIGYKLKPYVKLGHSDRQDLLQKEGLPSAGWITGLKRMGSKLLADIKNVPEKIYELIQSKAYGRISSEIFWNLKDEGKTYRRALKAIALLGADTPAVTSLDDFINLYTEADYEKLILCNNKETDMEDKDVKTYEMKIENLETEIKNYEMKLSEKDKELSEKDKIIEQYQAEKIKAFNQSVSDFLDVQVKDGKMTPAQKEKICALVHDEEDLEKVRQFVADQGQVVPMGETSKHQEIDKGEKSEGDILDEKIKSYMKEHQGISYADAFTAVAWEEGGK